MSPRITLTVPLGHYMELRKRVAELSAECKHMHEVLEAAEAYSRSLEVMLNENQGVSDE